MYHVSRCGQIAFLRRKSGEDVPMSRREGVVDLAWAEALTCNCTSRSPKDASLDASSSLLDVHGNISAAGTDAGSIITAEAEDTLYHADESQDDQDDGIDKNRPANSPNPNRAKTAASIISNPTNAPPQLASAKNPRDEEVL